MLWSDLRTAFRALRRHLGFTTINVVGLAVGIACCVLLGLYVRSELSYDDFHAHADRLVRVTAQLGEGEPPTGNLPPPLGERVEATVPGVETAVRWWNTGTVLRAEGSSINEAVYFADAEFFEVFSFPLRDGTAATALDGPNKVVLTRSAAERHFGTADAVGRTLQLRIDGEFETFRVSAVAEDPPSTSSLQFEVVGPLSRMRSIRGADYAESWGNFSTSAFLLLASGADRANVARQVNEQMRPLMEKTFAGAPFSPPTFDLQPITQMHLTSGIGGRGVQAPSSPMYAYVLGGLALLILIVACLNFANLSVGRSLRRTTEIGVRKALGAHRHQLAQQFLVEALLASAGAAVLGIGLAIAVLSAFNAVVGKSLTLSLAEAPLLAAGFAGITLVTTLLAGGYPAVILSRFDPSNTLRHRRTFGVSGGFAKGMVVVQFASAVFLVASAFVMGGQMQYVQDQDLGYEPRDLVQVRLGRGDGTQVLDRLQNRLRGEASVEHLAATGGGITRRTVTVEGAGLTAITRWTTPALDEAKKLRIVAGRFLSDDRSADLGGENAVVNEAFVRSAGLQNPIGQRVTIDGVEDWTVTIVGVVADYHVQSLHQAVEPMILHHRAGSPGVLWARMSTGGGGGLATLEAAWRAVAPLQPFDYVFEQQRVDRQYRTDRRWLQIVGVAAGLALFVALLGLIGLAALTVAERRKEIGVRKALGATATQVVGLLARHVTLLVGAAFVVGAPAAYLATRPWIESFAVQAPARPLLYVGAGLTTLTVALAAISLQAFRASRIDPAQTLRNE